MLSPVEFWLPLDEPDNDDSVGSPMESVAETPAVPLLVLLPVGSVPETVPTLTESDPVIVTPTVVPPTVVSVSFMPLIVSDSLSPPPSMSVCSTGVQASLPAASLAHTR